MNCWRMQLGALGDMGYRAVAPSQRGYSPGARPDPSDPSNYHIDRLMDARPLWEGEAFLEKPFNPVGLREAISLLLHGTLKERS